MDCRLFPSHADEQQTGPPPKRARLLTSLENEDLPNSTNNGADNLEETTIGDEWLDCLCEEDLGLLLDAYSELLPTRPEWSVVSVRDHQSPLPTPRIVSFDDGTASDRDDWQCYDDPELVGILVNSTGCARTQPFCKKSHDEKRRILEWRWGGERIPPIMSRMGIKNEKRPSLLKAALGKSPIHGWGVYAMERIPEGSRIVEYLGELIRPLVASEREKLYREKGIESDYMFRIDDDHIVDATFKGNNARFFNHSCDPNAVAKVDEKNKRIFIHALKKIAEGEEITFDYNFGVEEVDRIVCRCGTKKCRGYLN